MRIVPSSTVTLYSGVEIDNGEQLAFASVNGQNAYFASKLVLQAVPCTMVRKTGALRLEVAGSVVKNCNYLSFVNPDFDNKTVYARIIDYDYINNECVEIAYAIDYWQTWMFDVEYEDMFIEREHLSEADWDKAEINPYDPTIFEFRTDENLAVTKDMEKAEYEISGQSNNDGLKIALASHSLTTATDELGVLIKLANIDFAKIDADWTPTPGAPSAWTTAPSWKFAQYLITIVSRDFGFVYMPQTTWDYFQTLCGGNDTSWTGAFPTRKGLGSGWTSANITPFNETAYEPPCMYIYDPHGASNTSTGSGLNMMSTLFNILVSYTNEYNMSENTIVNLNIIPNDIMTLAGSIISTGTPMQAGIQPAQSISVDSKKLLRFPFCYARIISPNGDVKELKYEKFIDLQQGQGTAYVFVSMDLTETPTLIVAPANYKWSGMSKSSNVNTNIEEALFFSQFPTLPYNIDAYTAQCAAVTNDLIANRTAQNEMDMTVEHLQYNTLLGKMAAKVSLGGDVLGSGLEMLGATDYASATAGLGKFISTGSNAMLESDIYDIKSEKQKLKEKAWQEATKSLGEADGGEIARQLKLTKAAYAADHYYPSNGVGCINFNDLSYCDVILLNVSLNPDVLAVYDRYFKNYGYTSGRCGIPRICNYVTGSSTPADVPHWETINGKDTTYIKTMDCKIKYSMIPVASTIKEMFDSGVRMIKGDSST